MWLPPNDSAQGNQIIANIEAPWLAKSFKAVPARNESVGFPKAYE
jgi:hypothetical protein